MDGSLRPIEGRPELIAYPQGAKSGPSVFPRTRWNKQHTKEHFSFVQNHICHTVFGFKRTRVPRKPEKELCDHKAFVRCYTTMGVGCDPGCGFVKGIDDQPQTLVASAMKMHAAKKDLI